MQLILKFDFALQFDHRLIKKNLTAIHCTNLISQYLLQNIKLQSTSI